MGIFRFLFCIWWCFFLFLGKFRVFISVSVDSSGVERFLYNGFVDVSGNEEGDIRV